jgi:hypothetical protein
MKKPLFILFFILVNTYTLSAQHDTMLGKWTEEYSTYLDTLDAGKEAMNLDYKAFTSGKKILSKEFIRIAKTTPKEGESWILTLSKENQVYWMTDGKHKWKLQYNSKEPLFTATLFDSVNVIYFDEKANRLVLKRKNTNGQSTVLKRL